MNEVDSVLAVLGFALCGANVEGNLSTFVEEGDELVVERIDLEAEGVEVEGHAVEFVMSEGRGKERRKGGKERRVRAPLKVAFESRESRRNQKTPSNKKTYRFSAGDESRLKKETSSSHRKI